MGMYADSPPAPDYGKAAMESAEAEMRVLPLRYKTELEYRPKFDELEFLQQQRSMEAMLNYLMGEPATTYQTDDVFARFGAVDDAYAQANAAHKAAARNREIAEIKSDYLSGEGRPATTFGAKLDEVLGNLFGRRKPSEDELDSVVAKVLEGREYQDLDRSKWLDDYIKKNPQSAAAQYAENQIGVRQGGILDELQELDFASQEAALERAERAARSGYELDAEFMPIMADLNAKTQLEIQDKYGDEFIEKSMEQARKMDPDWFATREALADMVMSDLEAGNKLTDSQARQVVQQFRKSQAARGNMLGTQVSADEVMEHFLAGEGMRDKRMRRASAFLAGQQPSSQSAGVQTAQGGAAPYQVMKPGSLSTYNPNAQTNYSANPAAFQGFGNAGSIWNQAGVNAGTQAVYGQQATRFNQAEQAKNSFWSDMAGSAMGIAGGMMLCWVAREVYGEANPKWQEFREWMLEDAPPDLREAYEQYGEQYAEHIRTRPHLKERWRKFMDKAIAEHRLLNGGNNQHESEDY